MEAYTSSAYAPSVITPFREADEQPPSAYASFNPYPQRTQSAPDPAYENPFRMPMQHEEILFQPPTSFEPSLHDAFEMPRSEAQLPNHHFPGFMSRPLSPLSTMSTAELAMPAMQHRHSWAGNSFVDFQNSHPPFDFQPSTSSTMLPPSHYGSFSGDGSSIGVDPSFIQQLPTPPLSISTHHTLVSQPPLESPLRPKRPIQQLEDSNDSHDASPTLQLPTGRPRKPSRNLSVHSDNSTASKGSAGQASTDDEGRERTLCSYPDCGKSFKDLKAHMLTHQNERPEKCPITSCDFHRRGFARKYDRNRHLITTHYKATVVCGFCPDGGSPKETSFSRIDTFKRHLVGHHGVDQTCGASRKRTARGAIKQSPSVDSRTGGKCSTCGDYLPNTQALFDHLDDCILAVVMRPDASEAVNARHLSAVNDDDAVQATMRRHYLPEQPLLSSTSSRFASVDETSDVDDLNEARPRKALRTSDASFSTPDDGHDGHQSTAPRPGQPGLTYSRKGGKLNAAKGRRKKKHYPQSWGTPAEDMTLKKRVLCCLDGQQRLLKDDMMLRQEFQQRIALPDGGYVTDLDVQTLNRSEAYHNMTEEERASWYPTNYPGLDALSPTTGSYQV